jgi:hypothetical protein
LTKKVIFCLVHGKKNEKWFCFLSFLSFFFDEKLFSCQMDQKQNHFAFGGKTILPPRRLLGSSTTTILQPVHPTAPKVVPSCSLPLLRAVYALPPDPNPTPFRCVFSDGFRESAMFVFNLSVKLLSLLDCPIMPEGASSTNLQPNKDTKKFRMVP